MADIPQSRTEEILYATINGEEYTGLPESRIEELLLELKEVIEEGGGGGGGTSTIAWKPTVAADGTISWVRTASETKPEDQNIKGPKGDTGETGAKGDTGETGSQGPKGDDGDPGLGIKLVSINQQGHLIITFDDDTTQDAGSIPGGGGAVDPPVINLEGIASENDVNTKSATFTAVNTATYLLIEVIAGDSFPVITSSSVTVNGDDVNLKEYYSDSAHINSKYAILDLEAGDVVAASVRSSIETYGTSASIMLIKLSSSIQNLVLKDSDARTSGECSVDFNADKDGFYLLFFFDRREGSGIDFNTIKLNDETITKNRIICQVSEGWEVRQGMCIASAKALDNFKVSSQARGYADAVGIFYVETGSDVISYSDLTDKPQINGVELSGNKTASDLGLATSASVSAITDGQSIDSFSDVETALAGKADTSDLPGVATSQEVGLVKPDGVTTTVDANGVLTAVGGSETAKVYGFHISDAESNPSSKVTYLEDAIGFTPAYMNYSSGKFEYGSWVNAFFMPKPCMLKQDGTVDYYLHPSDYSKKEDGTASDVANTAYNGNAMMEWPKIYMKIVPDSGDSASFACYISNKKVDDDYHAWAYIDANGVEKEHFYTAIYNSKIVNNVARSLSGQNNTMNDKTASDERTALRANNASGELHWDMESFSERMLITNLMILISKTTDSQTAFGKGLMDSGTASINNSFTTGIHNTKGLFYGTNNGSASIYSNAVKIFGMENYYAFRWRRIQGFVLDNGVIKTKLCYGTADGSTADDYSFEATGYVAEASLSTLGNSDGQCNKVVASERGVIPYHASSPSASSSTYYCDYHYVNLSIVVVPLVSGASDSGARCGAFCWDLDYGASASYWNVGAALSCR